MSKKEFDNVWDQWGDGTFEDVILSKATKLKHVKNKREKLHAMEELLNYSRRYLSRLITGK